ncbi:MAG: BAX inhibitor (BI)-1/YccA family protein, partial [Hyphomonas sp.]
MNDFNRSFGAVDARTMDTSVNAGLRTFMLGVYQKLALGIALSGGIAFLVGSTPALFGVLVGTPLFYVFQFGPLALIFGSVFLMKNP